MIEQLKESLKEFDDEFAIRVDEKIGDKIYKNQDYGDFYGQRKDVKHFLITHTISILEAEVERLKLAKRNEIGECIQNSEGAFIPSQIDVEREENYNQTIQDQITYLNDQIKKIKEM